MGLFFCARSTSNPSLRVVRATISHRTFLCHSIRQRLWLYRGVGGPELTQCPVLPSLVLRTEESMKSIVLIIGFALISTTAVAYTQEQARLCTADAFRLCGSHIPDEDQVGACMRKQKASLSLGCKSVFDHRAKVQDVTIRN